MFAFAAFAMGSLDTLSLEVYHWGFPSKGLEGTWETINLHGFLEMEPGFVSAKGLHPITWRMLGLCMLLYASGTLVAAVLTLTIAWRTAPKECPSCGQRSLRVYPRADGLDAAGLPFLLLALLAGWMWRSYWWIFGALLYGALVRVGDKLCARFGGIWYWGGTRCAHCSSEVMLE
ncbi:MAG: hypothetical protein IPK82_20520 [Polyangiaceae bacterium]|nr:hypothetical protein [Polyangiaceae bacterium]MBK8255030.1 hypothetical protein [Polyangiaceae bacterium]